MPAEPGLPGPRQEPPDPARALPDNSPPGPGRLLALSDGVVAIALTLLVLDLRVPAIGLLRHPDSASALAAQLGRDTDQLISYVVSFYVIAQFWLTHHRVFRVVTGHSEGLAWWNFAFLLAITLVPFTSGLLGLYAENPLAVDIFAANILLASLALVATTRFIQRKGLRSAAHDEEQARAGRIRAFSVAAIMVVSMAVAWWNADLAKYLWILIAFLPDIVIRATRRRPGPPPAARTSRRLAEWGRRRAGRSLPGRRPGWRIAPVTSAEKPCSAISPTLVRPDSNWGAWAVPAAGCARVMVSSPGSRAS